MFRWTKSNEEGKVSRDSQKESGIDAVLNLYLLALLAPLAPNDNIQRINEDNGIFHFTVKIGLSKETLVWIQPCL